jgi:hypothetical protein
MKKTIRSLLLQFLALSLLIGAGLSSAYADTFGSGGYQFTIDFTTIGNPGNAADETGYGSVGYTYRMGTYAISLYDIIFAQLSGLDHVTANNLGGVVSACDHAELVSIGCLRQLAQYEQGIRSRLQSQLG